MRIDYENRKIACSVNDLVHDLAHRRIGSDKGEGFRRMWIGQEIHSRRAEQRAEEDPLYRPEFPVSYRAEVRSWTVEVGGRIDGISIDREAKRITIEEVKSIHFDLELASLYRSDKLQRYLYQLMLYAYFLSSTDEYAEFTFTSQLVLIDLLTERVQTIDAPFDRDDVASALDASVTRLVDLCEAEHAMRLAKQAFADALEFPFDAPRPYQSDMIEAVARAVAAGELLLASAPTGIGKTIAALYPAVRESLRRGKKLFFLTSKTLQQEMAVKALGMLNDGSFRTLRIRAKQKMCAHTEVICHEDFCPYAKAYGEKMLRNNLVPRIVNDFDYFDPDIVFELSKSEEVCPFEVSLELVDQADVIVCDYNYIFDPYVGLKQYAQEEDWGECVLIIDEAHNLVDRGRGYYSPELLEKQLDEVKWHLASRPGAGIDEAEYLLDELRHEFALMSEELPPATGSQAECELRKRFFTRHRSEWERIIIRYVGWKIENRIAEEEDPIIDFYFKLVKFANVLSESGEEFSHIVERTADGLKLKIFCKDASKFLGRIIDSAHAAIAMSATLEPFEFYRKTLGFTDARTSEISLPSPFPRDHRKVIVVPEVDTTYKSREQHYGRIATLVSEMSGEIRGNVLVLFPSYAFLDQIVSRCGAFDKELLVQRSQMTDYERAHLLSVLRRPSRNGTVIMAVSGGMYAEGIDYQGDMLSAVFVVGPSLPSVSFEQELLKRYYDDMYGCGFEYAYLVPGMTRVVQSAGRVIRSEHDRGVIALLCKRFTYESYNRYFPAEWYERSPRELVTKKPGAEIRAFFEAAHTPQLRLLK